MFGCTRSSALKMFSASSMRFSSMRFFRMSLAVQNIHSVVYLP